MGNCLETSKTQQTQTDIILDDLKDHVKEVKEEIKQQVKEDVKEEIKQDLKEEKQQVKEDIKEEIKQDLKEETKEDVKKEKQEVKEAVKEEAKEEVKEEDVYKDCTDKNTPNYSYEGLKKKVKILRVIDGDTVDIALHHSDTNKIFKYRVRLYGIDTPEKRPPKNDPNRDKEIEASKRASLALTEYLYKNDNIVLALFYKPDKYGRLLCTFYDKCGEDMNKWMVKQGYAYEYFGKTKEKFKEDSE